MMRIRQRTLVLILLLAIVSSIRDRTKPARNPKPTFAGGQCVSEKGFAYGDAGQVIDVFFGKASQRFGTLVETSSPVMIKKILTDFNLMNGDTVVQEMARTKLSQYLTDPISMDELKASLKNNLMKNEQAFAPTISVMFVAVKENLFDYKFESVPDANAVSKCLNANEVASAVWNDVANCWVAEWANALLVMEEINQALLDLEVAKKMWDYYSGVAGTRFQVGKENWQKMLVIDLYDIVSKLIYKRGEDFKAAQFKGMKLLSVMMPFESLKYTREQFALGKKLEPLPADMNPAPRWKPVYDDWIAGHNGESAMEPMQVNVAEANIGDVMKGWGNSYASNALIEILKKTK